MFYLAGGREEVVENDDFQEAEAFACIGRKMVCNQRGTRGQEASSVREKQAAPAGQRPNCRQGCDPCPTPPNLAMHCLIGKASVFQPANSGRPPPSPHTHRLSFFKQFYRDIIHVPYSSSFYSVQFHGF